MPMGTPRNADLIELASGATRVCVAPLAGGSIAAYYEVAPDGPLHWFRPATGAALASGDPLGMASFPLFPYCNRIRNAKFDFDGRTIDLSGPDDAHRHALHGHGWRRPWQVERLGETQLDLHFEHRPDPRRAGDWPFHYEARQAIRLDGNALSITLFARNLGASAMPFGMGHHPYYVRTPHTVVKARVDAMWHADEDVLPIGVGAHPAVDALRNGMPVDAFDLDNNFVGWAREAAVIWPERGRQVVLQAERPFDQLVVFAPAGADLLCVEPVTNTTDSFNAKEPASLVGGCVLAPGESLQATLRWTPGPA
ncbi:aldose 1-epimerase [Burkholderia stabilis]|uniref:Aldose 1-epimerase,putative aldose-1-epimerase,Aldose 1-epimerase n=1 Tax=Burkholderia stabilis TaxID=95485 RepID=A0AAJ5NJI4_9BURK|nr:aldose 1-epimerase [Burkholderia stabilis]VBB16150.1 Aldose 1-epimerase,putative aldose-1-epimerase,Aldose 1-epimerase [Burkholderia stabilis]